MDHIAKALALLSEKERKAIRNALLALQDTEQRKNIQVKKLRGRDDVYRVRVSNVRIIFLQHKSGEFFVLAIERRSEKTYRAGR